MSQQGSLLTGGGGNLPGNSVQFVQAATGANVSIVTTIPRDGSIPQQTEGTEFLTLAITPTKATNRLVLTCAINAQLTAVGGSRHAVGALFQDTTANALTSITMESTTIALTSAGTFTLHYTMIAGTILPTTFKLRAGLNVAGGTLDINPTSYGNVITTFTIMEIEV